VKCLLLLVSGSETRNGVSPNLWCEFVILLVQRRSDTQR
jgi:hypothetical protein